MNKNIIGSIFMKKIAVSVIFTFFALTSLFAVGVNEPELKYITNSTIEFENYSGPHRVIESAQSIKDIGGNLGKSINPTESNSVGYSRKYYLVHSVEFTNKAEKKLDADILYIGPEANVDHINNVRRIISGYLTEAYGYSEKDADTLAVFITVYNAVYRGQYDTLSNKYKDTVMTNLSKDNCGLSISYKEWPGKSEIIIPLFDVQDGGLSTVDTSVISDSSVIDSMKKDDDRNIDARKDMVDLKEREADESSEKAVAAQKQAVEEQKKLNEAKKDAEKEKKEAEEAQKIADEAKKYAEEHPEDKKAQEDAENAQKEADKEKSESEEADKKVEEQKEKTDAAKAEAAEKQTIADKKQTEAQTERKEIATDQQIVQKEEQARARALTEYGLIVTDENELLCKLVKFNIENGKIIKNSPVSVIRSRIFYEAVENESLIAIAGQNQGNGTIKLVLIDEDKMEIISESNETISPSSPLIKDGDNYYCVIEDNGKWVIGKYDNTLTLLKKSLIPVVSETPIIISKTGLVVTDSSNALRVLDINSLESIY